MPRPVLRSQPNRAALLGDAAVVGGLTLLLEFATVLIRRGAGGDAHGADDPSGGLKNITPSKFKSACHSKR